VSTTASRAPSRQDDPVRIRHGRIQQLDLEADHGVKTDRLCRADEADGPVEPGMIRDGETGQAQLDGSLDQLIRGRRTIEEREVGVAVEFGVWGLNHGSFRSGRLTGADKYRTNVLALAMKQDPSGRRLTGMHAPLRQVLVPVLRAGAMVALAMLLILGLFPAILAAQAGRT
jgi:hypothetical protein